MAEQRDVDRAKRYWRNTSVGSWEELAEEFSKVREEGREEGQRAPVRNQPPGSSFVTSLPQPKRSG